MKVKDLIMYSERIEEIYEIETLADDGIPVHLWNPKYWEEKLKEILEGIYQKGYTQGYTQCEIDIANDDRYSLREEAKP